MREGQSLIEDERRKDEANVSPGVGTSGRCATALPGSHLNGGTWTTTWGPPSPRIGGRGLRSELGIVIRERANPLLQPQHTKHLRRYTF
ncbi:hypothetical protein KQX54_005286 [Cotesia glomerata]|uniref:Uncharacterized protein n=1 Tax=Cotesia glomerata TaxID=32391 RepID=A0AAV7J2A5_COTGL|nr:hypothetical protein KQX54_005286 [Cotesia glomerata]